MPADTPLERTLRESAAEVLERMFFVCAEGNDPDARPFDPDLVVHLDFEGQSSGTLMLGLTAGFARSIAAGFLGEEEERVEGQRVRQVAGELANMICGSVLSRLESTAQFRLASPRLEDPVPPAPPAGAFWMCGGALMLAFDTEGACLPVA